MFWELILYVQKDSRGKNIEDLIAISISLQNTAMKLLPLCAKVGCFLGQKKRKGYSNFRPKK